MTQEQKDIFIKIMANGVYCGCDKPNEALLNFLLHTLQRIAYNKVAEEKKVISTFAEFYRESYKDTGEFFDGITDEKFIEWIYQPFSNKFKEARKIK